MPQTDLLDNSLTGLDQLCKLCGLIFLTENALFGHCRQEHSTRYCDLCRGLFVNDDQLQTHICETERPFTCWYEDCDAEFRRLDDLMLHAIERHDLTSTPVAVTDKSKEATGSDTIIQKARLSHLNSEQQQEIWRKRMSLEPKPQRPTNSPPHASMPLRFNDIELFQIRGKMRELQGLSPERSYFEFKSKEHFSMATDTHGVLIPRYAKTHRGIDKSALKPLETTTDRGRIATGSTKASIFRSVTESNSDGTIPWNEILRIMRRSLYHRLEVMHREMLPRLVPSFYIDQAPTATCEYQPESIDGVPPPPDPDPAPAPRRGKRKTKAKAKPKPEKLQPKPRKLTMVFRTAQGFVTCPGTGCKVVFRSYWLLVHHLESGDCVSGLSQRHVIKTVKLYKKKYGTLFKGLPWPFSTLPSGDICCMYCGLKTAALSYFLWHAEEERTDCRLEVMFRNFIAFFTCAIRAIRANEDARWVRKVLLDPKTFSL